MNDRGDGAKPCDADIDVASRGGSPGVRLLGQILSTCSGNHVESFCHPIGKEEQGICFGGDGTVFRSGINGVLPAGSSTPAPAPVAASAFVLETWQ